MGNLFLDGGVRNSVFRDMQRRATASASGATSGTVSSAARAPSGIAVASAWRPPAGVLGWNGRQSRTESPYTVSGAEVTNYGPQLLPVSFPATATTKALICGVPFGYTGPK